MNHTYYLFLLDQDHFVPNTSIVLYQLDQREIVELSFGPKNVVFKLQYVRRNETNCNGLDIERLKSSESEMICIRNKMLTTKLSMRTLVDEAVNVILFYTM